VAILAVTAMDFAQILSLIIGPLVGVLVAYQINEWRRESLAFERKQFFKNLILKEVGESIALLKSNRTNLIPADGWNSLVNSGDVALFKDHAIKFSNLYFKIQMHNYEAIKTRDALESEISSPKFRLVNEGTLQQEMERTFPRFSELKGGLLKTSDILLKDLKEFEEWLKIVDVNDFAPGYNDPKYEEIKAEKAPGKL
jgi:hypothetical protein